MTTSDPRPDNPTDLPAGVARLLEQGTVTVVSVDLLRKAIDRNSRIQRYSILIATVLIVVLVFVLVDSRRQIHTLQHQVCPIVELSIPRPGDAPPTTQHGRDVIAASERLAKRFGCDHENGGAH